MPALQHVKLVSQHTILSDESLLTLSRMQHLKSIGLCFYPYDFASSQTFARLVYLLARDHANVVVRMGSKLLSDDL